MNIIDLCKKRAEAWEECKKFLDEKHAESDVLSAEDDAIYQQMEQKVTDLGKEIERLKKREVMDRSLDAPLSTPITNTPKARGGIGGRRQRPFIAGDEYKMDFGAMLRSLPLVYNAMAEGTSADGGYLVPSEMERQILMGLDQINIIRGRAKVISTNAERKIPVALTHSTAAWTAEATAYTESSPTFDQKILDAYKLTDLIKISNELLQDAAFDIENYIVEEIIRAFGNAEEEAFCVGTGSGQPTGIFTENGGEVGLTSAASSVTADELISLVYALKAPYRRQACFIMSDEMLKNVRQLKDKNDAYLWQLSLRSNEPDRLLGYPVYTSAYVPAPESGNLAIAFGDFGYYWIADRQGRTIQRLEELYSINGQIGYIASERVDGKVVLPEAIQLLKIG